MAMRSARRRQLRGRAPPSRSDRHRVSRVGETSKAVAHTGLHRTGSPCRYRFAARLGFSPSAPIAGGAARAGGRRPNR
eukprot:2840108-Prymnesium_polylepis.1